MLCDQIGISRANLYRKIKAISELSPTELIRNKRLEVALRYLKETNMSVSEVATCWDSTVIPISLIRLKHSMGSHLPSSYR